MKNVSILLIFLLTGLSSHLYAQKMKIKVTVGTKEFTATLNDSEASEELVKMLPMTLNMSEHGNIEKTVYLSKSLPGRANNPGLIQAGDIMVWSSRSLVLFYSSHRTSYSYIRLGKIDNISGLREALGRGSVEVKYELIK